MTPIYKNGKYGYRVQINYTDKKTNKKIQIVRCNEHTRTKSDAKAYEVELLATLKNGISVDSLTFEQLYYKFIDERKNELKINTIREYKQKIPTYVFPMFKEVKIDAITKEDIIKWKNWLLKNYTFTTINFNNIFKCFNAVMNYAVNYYDLKSNPLCKVDKFKNPNLIVEDDIDFWTYEEFNLFINAVNSHLEKQTKKESIIRWSALKTCYMILFFGGLRKSEALGLLWKDIIEVNGKLYLNIYKTINQYVTPYEFTSTKNKSSVRKVPISLELKDALEQHKQLCENIYSFNEENFFVCGSYAPLPKNAVGNVMLQIEKECGLHHIRVHDLRHSYCSMLINGGIPLSTIAKLMGHSTTEITQKVYSHIYPNSNDDVIAFIDNLSNKKKEG